jgi:hypothetical protein
MFSVSAWYSTTVSGHQTFGTAAFCYRLGPPGCRTSAAQVLTTHCAARWVSPASWVTTSSSFAGESQTGTYVEKQRKARLSSACCVFCCLQSQHMAVPAVRPRGSACSQTTWYCLQSDHVAVPTVRPRGSASSQTTCQCLQSDHMELPAVRPHGTACSQTTWQCLQWEHMAVPAVRPHGTACSQTTWQYRRVWLQCSETLILQLFICHPPPPNLPAD